ncbi:MAG: AraC-like DNA-binding protein/quercetin dioxygenase-like cupin family protein [Kiritimatiellia bacterium]|jgi:AraC-like DNA-binding protein/quercetin dioxygenase-like cupin family protein
MTITPNNEDKPSSAAPLVVIDGPLECVVVRPATFKRGHKISAHRHQFGQVIHPSSGMCLVKTQSGMWTVPCGLGVWVPPMKEHEVDFLSDTVMQSIYLDARFTQALPSQCTAINIPPILYELAVYTANIKTPNVDDLAHALAIVIARLTQDSLNIPLHIPMPSDPSLRKIYTCLIDEPADPRSIEAWGEYIGASGRTLSRRLKQETGINFRSWRQQIRLLSSLEKLAKGQAVTAVAYDTGYESTSAFTHAFKQSFGVTPSAFVNTIKKR